ncbi:hypothetical protein V8F06_001744 [Rhypophila decipiens]
MVDQTPFFGSLRHFSSISVLALVVFPVLCESNRNHKHTGLDHGWTPSMTDHTTYLAQIGPFFSTIIMAYS